VAGDKVSRTSIAAALGQEPTGRFGAWCRRWQSLLRVLFGAAVLALGFWGLVLKTPVADWSGAFNAAFQTLQMLTFQFPKDIDGALPWQLNLARFLLPALALVETYRLVLGSVRRPIRLALAGMWRDHVVITVGSAAAGFHLLRHLRGRSMKGQRRHVAVIALGLGEDEIALIEAQGAAVIAGDPRSGRAWHGACADRAAAVIVAHGIDTENLNAAVAMMDAIGKRAARRGNMPVAVVLIENDTLAARVEVALDGATRESGMRYRRLSGAEEAARAVFVQPPLPDRKADRDAPSHILVLGGGPASSEVIRAALTLAQDAPSGPPLVTILAEEKEIEARPLLDEDVVPGFIGDVRVVECKWDAGLPAKGKLAKALDGRPPVTLACVCRDDDGGMLTGLALARLAEAEDWPAMDICVHQKEEDRFLSTLSASDVPFANSARLRPFGGVLPAGTIPRILDGIADVMPRALHDHYLTGLERQGAGVPGTRRGWEELPENLRHASRASAEHIPVKLAAIGFRLEPEAGTSDAMADEEIEALSRIEHRRWAAERALAGWRHGRMRDDRARLHPDLVPYEELDDAAREKDRDMVRALPEVLALAGMRMRRIMPS